MNFRGSAPPVGSAYAGLMPGPSTVSISPQEKEVAMRLEGLELNPSYGDRPGTITQSTKQMTVLEMLSVSDKHTFPADQTLVPSVQHKETPPLVKKGTWGTK